jgi:hypothetical protein
VFRQLQFVWHKGGSEKVQWTGRLLIECVVPS